MPIKDKSQKFSSNNFSIFCWNIANPSPQRAGEQALWLHQRPENVFVLTEAKKSEGCLFLEKYFRAYGYNVIFPKPKDKEYGTMIISKKSLTPSSFSDQISYLRTRVVSAELSLLVGRLEIIGVYVPSRDASYEKINRKKRFLNDLVNGFGIDLQSRKRIFCGDLNVLEPDHIPNYSFFREWEYDFYRNLKEHQLNDAFRHLNPSTQEYSWIGRTNDGYRYDHCFVSDDLLPLVQKCFYLHEPREVRLSDHSALITELSF